MNITLPKWPGMIVEGITKSIPSRDGKSVYKQSEYDGTWWKVWNDDRPRVFIGMNPPKNP